MEPSNEEELEYWVEELMETIAMEIARQEVESLFDYEDEQSEEWRKEYEENRYGCGLWTLPPLEEEEEDVTDDA
jgi:hypothetical protein